MRGVRGSAAEFIDLGFAVGGVGGGFRGARGLCSALMHLVGTSWTPKVCKIMALMAMIMALGLLFYTLLGFRLRQLAGGSGVWREVGL